MTPLESAQALVVLLIAMLALTAIARRLLLPYPIVLVLGGLVLGLMPGLAPIPLEPDLVFLVFLPPILWAAAYFTSLRDFKANLRPITLLAFGLVFATTAAVAVAAHALIPGIGWAPAIVLGAIVSPPDAVAATAIGHRLVIPRRVVTILEGESLVNDASALVIYRTAVAATVTGHFVVSDALSDFVLAIVVGVLVGLAVAKASIFVMARTTDGFTEIAITLLGPYSAWVIADRFHASAVLACVVGGFTVRRHYSEVAAPTTRLQAKAVWEQLIFFLNGAIFVLIGLQVGVLRAAMPAGQMTTTLIRAGVISLVCIVVRLAWVPMASWLPRKLSASLRAREPRPPWSGVFVVAWTGMRGIVSLASALALPLTISTGEDFPFRTEIVLISFGVIFATLVGQGLTLPPLLRALHFPEDDTLVKEEQHAREQATAAALEHIGRLATEPWAHPEPVERLRVYYSQRDRRVSHIDMGGDAESRKQAAAYRRLRHATIDVERKRVIELRNRGTISDDVLERIEHELDVEALRIGAGDHRLTGPTVTH